MPSTLSPQDIAQLTQRGVDKKQMDAYHGYLTEGFPFVQLASNCEIGKHIQQFSAEKRVRLRKLYQAEKEGLRIVKFVPASGAASRMFKDLFTFLETGNESEAVAKFFLDLPKYAFFNDLMKHLDGIDQAASLEQREKNAIVEFLLLGNGLNYGGLPKGLIKFHRYPDGHARTAFEEHFHEARMYASADGEAHLHFTIPEGNKEEVEAHLNKLKACLDEMLNVTFKIETSLQMPATDTPAIYEDNHSWARLENGELLFRPAGHGALLSNLNEIDADVVFIKNIDNVVPDNAKAITVEYKELLAGVLLEVQSELFRFLEQAFLEGLDRVACEAFFQKWFLMSVRDLPNSDLIDLMNRPLRVCGMVRNEGEPGGGPFLVKEEDGTMSLQIVESAQVDPDSEEQQSILKGASHFNPVDIVVGLKNHRGERFDLLKYRNSKTGMVVFKTHQGKPIRALELPGLWNGSMHFWNTIFVEVPIETFNPVKTVFDLARPQHQS